MGGDYNYVAIFSAIANLEVRSVYLLVIVTENANLLLNK